MTSKLSLMDTSRKKNALVFDILLSNTSNFLVLNNVPILRYKESIKDIEWSEPVELWNIDDEG
jgi:hypothetical protein